MADAVHTLRHISYGYEILSWCVPLWYRWVSVLLGLYVNPAVTPRLHQETDIWDMFETLQGKMMQSEAKTLKTVVSNLLLTVEEQCLCNFG